MNQVHIVSKKGKRKILKRVKPSQIQENFIEGVDGRIIDSNHELISLLLPPAVKAFYAELDHEVRRLCGERHSRGGEASRWGAQAGSIVLGNQRVAIEKPRVRGEAGEVELATYERFQDPKLFR